MRGEKISDYAQDPANTNAAIPDSRSSNPSPERVDGHRRRNITASLFKILFKDGQPGRRGLGNGKAVARELPPASGGSSALEGWMTLPVSDPQRPTGIRRETDMAAVLQ